MSPVSPVSPETLSAFFSPTPLYGRPDGGVRGLHCVTETLETLARPPSVGIAETPFGLARFFFSSLGLMGCEFQHRGVFPTRSPALSAFPSGDLDNAGARAWAEDLFSSSRDDPLVLHMPSASPFRYRCWWRGLAHIRPGKCVSYGQLAAWLGLDARRHSRAVGQAVSHNLLGWVLPCHRVLAASGALHHYRWGTDLKARMLAFEQKRGASNEAVSSQTLDKTPDHSEALQASRASRAAAPA